MIARRGSAVAGYVCLALGACVPGSNPPAGGSSSTPVGPEALPPPWCGEGQCGGACTSCSVKDQLCFGTSWTYELGLGDCRAPTSGGTFEVTIGGTAFVADEAAAIVDGSILEIVARGGGDALTLELSATPGDQSCDAGFTGSIAYYAADGTEFHNRVGLNPRPACAVSVVGVGGVGGTADGSFSATLVESSTNPTTLDLSNGTFRALRIAYP